MPETWHLFVDESGDFDGDRRVVLGGWLLHAEARDTEEIKRWLRTHLDQCLPLVPYPPHRTDCNLVATRLAGLLTRERERPAPNMPLYACLVALPGLSLLLANATNPSVEPVLAAIGAGKWPTFDALRTCSQWLHAVDPGVAARLRDLHAWEDAALFDGIADAPDARAFAIASFDVEPLSWPDETARYLALLDALFERALLFLRDRRTDVTVWAHVLVRHIARPALPNGQLMPTDVGASVERARASIGACPSVAILPTAPQQWHVGVHPGLVYADWIVNKLRFGLSGADADSWVLVAELARFLVALSPEGAFRGGRLPAFAVEGTPATAIRAAARAATSGKLAAGVFPIRWAIDQANAWIPVL